MAETKSTDRWATGANWLLILALVLITVGGLFIAKWGVSHRPQGLMKPSFFASTEELGQVVYRRLFPELHERSFAAIGLPPNREDWAAFVAGFLLEAAQVDLPYAKLVMEEGLDSIPLPPEVAESLVVSSFRTNGETRAALVDLLADAQAKKERVLIVTVSTFTARLLGSVPIQKLIDEMALSGGPDFANSMQTITLGPMSLEPDQEFVIDPPCVGTQRDQHGTSRLGCALLQASRSAYRRLRREPVPADKYTAVMELHHDSRDILVAIAPPGQVDLERPKLAPPGNVPPGFVPAHQGGG
jgi:hypothetical protein